jgi:DNA primase catalytic subunit
MSLRGLVRFLALRPQAFKAFAPHPPDSMHDAATSAFLRQLLTDYYAAQPTLAATRVERREWMMMDLDGEQTERFLAYPDLATLGQAAAKRAPGHIYHSLASYRDLRHARDAHTLETQRLGTEILLDIDCKPGPPPKGDGYANLDEALAAARGHTQQVCDLLLEDVGVEPKELEVAFTGSKGYRVILHSPRFQGMSQRSRTEFACFLTASGTRLDCYFPGPGDHTVRLPDAIPEGGSARRLHAALRRIDGMSRMQPPPHRLVALVERHNKTAADAPFILSRIANTGLVGLLNKEPGLQDMALRVARDLSLPRLDMAVVGNLAGLCRLAGSLNAKTGLQCRPIPPARLATFDPYTDANPHPRQKSIEVEGRADRAICIRGETFQVRPGHTVSMPLDAGAIFLFSGGARLAPARQPH